MNEILYLASAFSLSSTSTFATNGAEYGASTYRGMSFAYNYSGETEWKCQDDAKQCKTKIILDDLTLGFINALRAQVSEYLAPCHAAPNDACRAALRLAKLLGTWTVVG